MKLPWKRKDKFKPENRGIGEVNPSLKRPLYIILYVGLFFAFLPLVKEVPSLWWFVAVMLLSFYMDYTGRRPFKEASTRYFFTPILLAATIYTVFIRFSLISLVNLLLMLETAKLFGGKRIRDIIQIVVMGLFNLLMAAVFTIDIIFAFSILMFFIAAALIFAMINVSDEINYDRINLKELRPFSAIIGVTPIVSMVVAGAFFLIMPRTPITFFTGNFVDLNQNEGFREDVEIGYVGEMLSSKAVVFRAVPNEPVPQNLLYWRSITYSLYDGDVWLNRLKEYPVRGYHFSFRRARINGLPVFKVKYYMEPTTSRMLYTLDHPVEFSAETDIRFSFKVSSDYTIYYSRMGSSRITYETVSQTGPIPAVAVDSTLYFQLPERVYPEIKRLAAQFDSAYATDLEKARAVEDYFRSNFKYNLRIYRPRDGSDPLRPFFERREGYCEYFATAMALILREMGIPCRTVGGFRGGEWNDYGKYYIVRANMAHMWVEAVIGDSVWMRFDPTPSVEVVSSRRSFISSLMRRINNYLDYIRIAWYGDVVNYTFERQRSIFAPIVRNLFRRPKIDIKQLILLGLIAGLVVSLFRLLQHIISELRVPQPVKVYRRVLRRYERIHGRKQPDETPLEFARRIGAPEFERFVRVYYAVRFSDRADFQLLKRLAKELKRADSRKRHRSSGSVSGRAEPRR